MIIRNMKEDVIWKNDPLYIWDQSKRENLETPRYANDERRLEERYASTITVGREEEKNSPHAPS